MKLRSSTSAPSRASRILLISDHLIGLAVTAFRMALHLGLRDFAENPDISAASCLAAASRTTSRAPPSSPWTSRSRLACYPVEGFHGLRLPRVCVDARLPEAPLQVHNRSSTTASASLALTYFCRFFQGFSKNTSTKIPADQYRLSAAPPESQAVEHAMGQSFYSSARFRIRP